MFNAQANVIGNVMNVRGHKCGLVYGFSVCVYLYLHVRCVCLCVRVHRRVYFFPELLLPNQAGVSVYVCAVMFGELLCTSSCDPNESLQTRNCVHVYVYVSACGS